MVRARVRRTPANRGVTLAQRKRVQPAAGTQCSAEQSSARFSNKACTGDDQPQGEGVRGEPFHASDTSAQVSVRDEEHRRNQPDYA